MEKRYQVFVSSTYADLKEERQRVIQTLLEMDCIPSGMELFPAADEEQLEFIKRVINDCDYYLLIIGGRYGSVTAEGVSYTEKEYDYALERGIKVIALLHADPEEIPLAKSEREPELRERLRDFRERVANKRLVRFWKTADELPGLVAHGLSMAIKRFPAPGWIRAEQLPEISPEKVKEHISALILSSISQREEIYRQSRLMVLVHKLTPSSKIGFKYEVSIYAKRHGPDDISDVVKAEFFLGKSWGYKVFTGVREGNIIGVTVPAYGTFLCTCLITFTDGQQTCIYRYIDFEMGEHEQNVPQ